MSQSRFQCDICHIKFAHESHLSDHKLNIHSRRLNRRNRRRRSDVNPQHLLTSSATSTTSHATGRSSKYQNQPEMFRVSGEGMVFKNCVCKISNFIFKKLKKTQ